MVNLNAKEVAIEAAVIASLTPDFDAIAKQIAAEVRGEAARYSDSGDFANSIRVDSGPSANYRGVQDRVIYSDDPNARAIEYGFRSRSGNMVPGHMTFTRVANKYNRG